VSIVYLKHGDDREALVKMAFQQFHIQQKAEGKSVLLKPNIVSYEPYPTTTHPDTVEACIRLLQGVVREVVVADGPAWDAGDSESVLENHPLKASCDKFRVPLLDLHSKVRKMRARSLELEVSQLAFDFDLIISLPVLKSHGICDMTGALKNHIGFLSVDDKRRLHYRLDVNKVIAELNEIIKPVLYIVDGVQTLVDTNELRHGGKGRTLGYILAGSDPVSLDALGLELLAKVAPRLRRKRLNDVLHLRHSVALGIGEPKYEIVEW